MHRTLPFILLLLVPAFAGAQQSATEITPFVGYRFGGTFENEDETAKYEMQDSASFGLLINPFLCFDCSLIGRYARKRLVVLGIGSRAA